MASVGAIYELKNALTIHTTASSLYQELTKNNLLQSLKLNESIFKILKEHQITLSFDEVNRVFTNSHNDHIEHTNQELFSCCMDMENYLKTLPETLSTEVSTPHFENKNQTKNHIDTIMSGVETTKKNINTRLKRVCKNKQEIFCQDGVYTLIEVIRKSAEVQKINFKGVEQQLLECSNHYLKQVDTNYDNLFVTFSDNIDKIMKKAGALKENNQEMEMNRAQGFVNKKVQELSGAQEPMSPFQNDAYQGTRKFINDASLQMYYPALIAQIESYRATNPNVEERAFDILTRFAHEQKNHMNPEEITTISHNILKMLKIDSHFISSPQKNEDKTQNYIICDPEKENPILFEPNKACIKTTNGKEIYEPYTVTLDQNTISKMKQGEQVTVGTNLVTTDGVHIYQESMKLGSKPKTLVMKKPEDLEKTNVIF
ncbi:MAG: hypothetical protein KH135_01555 [Firmicutes bacterium]|nr:hypothetical protein [Bacillota bacterium]